MEPLPLYLKVIRRRMMVVTWLEMGMKDIQKSRCLYSLLPGVSIACVDQWKQFSISYVPPQKISHMLGCSVAA